MQAITSMDELEALYDAAAPRSITKVVTQLTPAYRAWIEASRFVVLSTVGPEGTDASPRGDIGPVMRIADDKTLLLPDWRGNNRLDSLRNIVRDGSVSLMFMVPGSTNVVRANGQGRLLVDPKLRASFEHKGNTPKCVIEFTIGELYFQCAKAILRSRLWGDTAKPDIPSAGEFVKELDQTFDGEAYDAGYETYAKDRMW